MVFNRRDLLKAFGVGATIIPVIGGVPEIAAPAQLIEVPKLRPIELEESVIPFGHHGKCRITVDMVLDGEKHFRFEADAFDIHLLPQLVDVTTSASPWRQRIPGLLDEGNAKFTASGRLRNPHLVS